MTDENEINLNISLNENNNNSNCSPICTELTNEDLEKLQKKLVDKFLLT